MKEEKDMHPPRWATQLLHLYCKAELLEDLEGDLYEYFIRNQKTKGPIKARLIYILDVVKFCRPYTLRKPEFVNPLFNRIMIGSYIKTSGRSMLRNKLFSSINVIGLAVSMTVGLFLIAVLTDILSYDRFHTHYNNIYRINSRYQYLQDHSGDFFATTSMKAAKAIAAELTGVESVAIMRRGFSGDMQYKETTASLKGFFANEKMLSVFTFKLLHGNPETALKEPFSVVITEGAAKKLFGNEPAIGQVILYDKAKEYTVTGVMQDVPHDSHMHFDILASLSTREITEKDNKREWAWDNMWNTWAYLYIPDPSHLDGIQAGLNALSVREDPTVKNTHIELILEPLGNIMTGNDLSNQIGRTLGRDLLLIFLGLTSVVILSACFNYTNLSIARSLKRTREVGIRKVIGALKGHVLGQFVTEALIISLISLLAAILLFEILKPWFLGLNPDLQELLKLDLSTPLLMWFLLFALLIGTAAGLFPALYFSSINAVQVLKGTFRVSGKLTGRKALIVVQYCISLILITATIIMYKQYHHFLAYDLGYNTKDILNIELKGNKPELLEKELEQLPEVKGMALSAMVTSVGDYWGTNMKNPNNPDDSAGVRVNRIDENYLPLLEHALLAGRNFNYKEKRAEEGEVIVNEQVLKRFDIADRIPSQAIGQEVRIEGKPMTIIGVIKDFQYGRANNKSGEEVIMRYIGEMPEYLNVKFSTTDFQAFKEKINHIWKKIDPVHPMEAELYEDKIKEGFKGMEASVKLAGFIAFLAIVIASLGMLGMVVFTTETRIREVSIRKVMGASEGRLLYLLGKGFFLLLLLAAAISLPVTWLVFEKIMLPMLANHLPLGVAEMTLGTLAVMVLALVMISSQTIKVARSNPAVVLKNE